MGHSSGDMYRLFCYIQHYFAPTQVKHACAGGTKGSRNMGE